MSAMQGLFNPIKLPSDEPALLFKRESLRMRGVGWLLVALWLVGLLAAWITFLLLGTGAGEPLQAVIRAGLLICMIAALPTFLFLFLRSWGGIYSLEPTQIRRSEDAVVRLKNRLHRRRSSSNERDSPPTKLDWNQVRDVQVKPRRGLARLINVGDILISSRHRERTWVLQHIDHPQAIAEEIRNNARLAAGQRTGGGEDAAARNLQTERREISLSLAWVFLRWLPFGMVMWALVVAWVASRLEPLLTIPFLAYFSLFSIILILPWWLVSFLRWWFRVYLVTERRVIAREGLLNITRRDLSLEDVVTATVIRSGLGRFIDVGHVQVMTAGLSGDIHMYNISGPDHIRRMILETQDLRRRRQEQMQLGDISRRLKLSLNM